MMTNSSEKTTTTMIASKLEEPTSGISTSEGRKGSSQADTTNTTRLDTEVHYTIFSLLYMNGFLLHCRKDWNKNVFICIVFCFLYNAAVRCGNGVSEANAVQQFGRQFVFLGFLVWCVYSTLESSPYNANHHNVSGFLSAILLPQQVARCRYLWNHQDDDDDNNNNHNNNDDNDNHDKTDPHPRGVTPALQEFTRHTMNVLRWVVVIMYFMAGFHKLNWDFLNPEVSCALDMVTRYFDLLGYEDNYTTDLPFGLSYQMPYMVLALEFVAPLLISFPSTQRLGMAIIIQFHLILLPVGFADFGSIAMSLQWLFLNPAVVRHIQLPFSYFTDATAIFVLFQVLTMIVWNDWDTEKVPWKAEEAAAVFFVYAIVWARVFCHTHHLPGPGLYLPRSWSSRAVIGLFVWYAMNPYFGLRTTGVLTMFSNLRTEGDRGSNHILLGSNPLRHWSYQDELVEVLDIDDRMAHKFEDGAQVFPLFQFQMTMRKVRKRPKTYDGFYVKVLYQGEIYETDNARTDPDFPAIFLHEPNYWERKYVDFRKIQPLDEPQVCSW